MLRSHRETLVSVLETFVHDPLCEWKEDAARAGRSREREEAANPMARDALAAIEGAAVRPYPEGAEVEADLVSKGLQLSPWPTTRWPTSGARSCPGGIRNKFRPAGLKGQLSHGPAMRWPPRQGNQTWLRANAVILPVSMWLPRYTMALVQHTLCQVSKIFSTEYQTLASTLPLTARGGRAADGHAAGRAVHPVAAAERRGPRAPPHRRGHRQGQPGLHVHLVRPGAPCAHPRKTLGPAPIW